MRTIIFKTDLDALMFKACLKKEDRKEIKDIDSRTLSIPNNNQIIEKLVTQYQDDLIK